MAEIGRTFRDWVLEQRPAGLTPRQVDDDHILFETDAIAGEVNLYPFEGNAEIVELRVTRRADDEALFFLHFLLEEMPRARELFSQMADALQETASHDVTRVLLCCTSALTTSMFAAKMGELARALSLDYEISAQPVEVALKEGSDYDAILLAPQVAHLRHQMIEAHPDTIVFEIPAKVFGSYDAGGALRLVMHAFRELQADVGDATLGAVRDLTDNRRALIITYFAMRDHSRLGYRLYDRGAVQESGSVRKQDLDYRDIDDLLGTMGHRGIDLSDLDAIGIAVPGVTCRGIVELKDSNTHRHDLGHALARRFNLPVFVDNNCNAAAVGCYVGQKEHESLVFYRHAFGHPAGGFGTVIDGRLLKGRGNLAGEPKYFEGRFAYDQGFAEALWSAEGLHELARNVMLAAISLISPDACYLAVDTIDDADEFRGLLAEELGWDYVPPVHIVTDYVQRVYLGELAMCLQKLRDPNYRSLGVGIWEDVEPRA